MPLIPLRTSLLLLPLLGSLVASEIPLGSKDFYPSAERPVGYIGDGRAWFPGATPVDHFRAGTLGTTTIDNPKPARGGDARVEAVTLKDDKAVNIVWKTRMPSFCNSQPIVVGDRVFVLSFPYTLVCCDAASGKILWTADGNPWRAAGADEALAAKLHALHEAWLATPLTEHMATWGTVTPSVLGEDLQRLIAVSESEALPRIVVELDRVDPQQKWQQAAAESLAGARALLVSKERKPSAKEMSSLRNLIQKRIFDLAQSLPGSPRIRVDSRWGYTVGSMMAPASDGEQVYATFRYGSTICVNLSGTVLWRRWSDPQYINDVNTQSPLLVGDTLIEPHGSQVEVNGVDKRSGKERWRARALPKALKAGGGYNVGNHSIGRIGSGSNVRQILVTAAGNILDPATGRELGYLPWPWDSGPMGGPSMLAIGPRSDGSCIVVHGSHGDSKSTPMTGFRLTLTDDGMVDAKKIYDNGPSSTGGYSHLVGTDRFVLQTDSHKKGPTVFEIDTGKNLVSYSKPWEAPGGQSTILAGSLLIWPDNGSKVDKNSSFQSDWKFRRSDGQAFVAFNVWNMTDPKNPKKISAMNLLGGRDRPDLPALKRLAPQLHEAEWYGSSAWGRPPYLMNTGSGSFASGNRLFIRTMVDLYCIGDPSVPYDWNSASRPAHIRVE